MGENIGYLCKNCGEEFSINVGVGTLDYPENLLDKNSKYNLLKICKNGNTKNMSEFEEFFKKDDLALERYGYIPFVCEDCKKIFSRFDFELSCPKEGLTFTPIYCCDKCKKELRAMTKSEVDNIKCPKCGSENLYSDVFMNWD